MTGNKHQREPRVGASFSAWRGLTSSFGTGVRGICLVLSVVVTGCRDAPRTGDPLMGLMVFVDLETDRPVVDLATNEVPAVHPETGRRTLMPGLYCPACERWHPTPAFDKLQRIPGAARCPDDGSPLISNGPWPTGEEP